MRNGEPWGFLAHREGGALGVKEKWGSENRVKEKGLWGDQKHIEGGTEGRRYKTWVNLTGKNCDDGNVGV